MSSFKKLIDSAKNQPAEQEGAIANNQTTEQEDAIAINSPQNKTTNGKDSTKRPVTNKQVSLKKNIEVGKRQDPNYRQTSIYVHKDLHRKVTRLLEDEGYEKDFSDWIEECMLSKIKHQKA